MPKQKEGKPNKEQLRRMAAINVAAEVVVGVVSVSGAGEALSQGTQAPPQSPDKPAEKDPPAGSTGGSKGGGAPAGGGCFAAGTRVIMGDGALRAIESIHAGDSVLAFDEPTGQVVTRPVLRTYTHGPRPILSLAVDGIAPAILVTPNHPFRVDRSWAPIGEAGPGARLTRYDAGSGGTRDCEVESLSPAPAEVPVHNLQIEGSATYFVEGVLVHNKPEETEEGPGIDLDD